MDAEFHSGKDCGFCAALLRVSLKVDAQRDFAKSRAVSHVQVLPRPRGCSSAAMEHGTPSTVDGYPMKACLGVTVQLRVLLLRNGFLGFLSHARTAETP
jgi:hypothetical protein